MAKRKKKKTSGKNKYSLGQLLFVGLGYIIIITIVGAALFLLFSSLLIEDYNPDKHTCIEKIISIEDNLAETEICSVWRDKTFCELCHNQWAENCSEECICIGEIGDGSLKYRGYGESYIIRPTSYWESDKPQLMIFNLSECHRRNGCDLDTNVMTPCIIDCNILYKNYLIDYVESKVYCHGNSTREKTECEKGNGDYFLETITECVLYGSTSEVGCWNGTHHLCGGGCFNCTNECIEEVVTPIECRKKTIYDYSCDELKDQIFIGNRYCQASNSWRSGALAGCGKGSYGLQGVKQVYVEKGCET